MDYDFPEGYHVLPHDEAMEEWFQSKFVSVIDGTNVMASYTVSEAALENEHKGQDRLQCQKSS